MADMEQQNNYIVFQCYGKEGVFLECGYALLSLALVYRRSPPAGMQVWIYTDNPAWFDKLKGITLSLNFRVIDNAIIQQWYGGIDFVHRMKIEVLKDFTKDRQGNVLYVDTDAVFMSSPDDILGRISEGALYMHVMEGVVSENGNPLLTKLNRHLSRNVPLEINGKPLQDLAMWNAGVIGFNTRYIAMLDDILAFTDREYPRFPKHIMEQFAFSIFLQKAGDVKAAAPYIVHYWNLKEARELLASFFAYFKGRDIDEMIRCSVLVQMHVLMQEKMNFIYNGGVAGRLLKKAWRPPQYDWQELMKQL